MRFILPLSTMQVHPLRYLLMWYKCFLVVFSCALFGQEQLSIMDNATQQPIDQVHVVFPSLQSATISNSIGQCYLPQYDDSLQVVISHIGFATIDTTLMKGSSSSYTLYLIQKSVDLSQINVTPFSNEFEFKRIFLSLKLPKSREEIAIENFKRTIPNLPPSPKVGSYSEGGSSGVAVRGAITDLYMALSKYEKRHAKYMTIIDETKRMNQWQNVYNTQFVMDITGIEDVDAAQEVLETCGFNAAYFDAHSAYEVAEALLLCYQDLQEKDR